MPNESLKWVTSGGGPLVILDKEIVRYWTGYSEVDSSQFSDKESNILKNENTSKASTDYERACDVNDYVGIIPVGSGCALILGEEPMPTAWWMENNSDAGMMIRWRWAQDEESAITAVRKCVNGNWSATGALFRSLSGDLVLFDSACPGVDLDCAGTGCLLSFHLGEGQYEIKTLFCEPDNETSLILHRFSPEIV